MRPFLVLVFCSLCLAAIPEQLPFGVRVVELSIGKPSPVVYVNGVPSNYVSAIMGKDMGITRGFVKVMDAIDYVFLDSLYYGIRRFNVLKSIIHNGYVIVPLLLLSASIFVCRTNFVKNAEETLSIEDKAKLIPVTAILDMNGYPKITQINIVGKILKDGPLMCLLAELFTFDEYTDKVSLTENLNPQVLQDMVCLAIKATVDALQARISINTPEPTAEQNELNKILGQLKEIYTLVIVEEKAKTSVEKSYLGTDIWPRPVPKNILDIGLNFITPLGFLVLGFFAMHIILQLLFSYCTSEDRTGMDGLKEIVDMHFPLGAFICYMLAMRIGDSVYLLKPQSFFMSSMLYCLVFFIVRRFVRNIPMYLSTYMVDGYTLVILALLLLVNFVYAFGSVENMICVTGHMFSQRTFSVAEIDLEQNSFYSKYVGLKRRAAKFVTDNPFLKYYFAQWYSGIFWVLTAVILYEIGQAIHIAIHYPDNFMDHYKPVGLIIRLWRFLAYDFHYSVGLTLAFEWTSIVQGFDAWLGYPVFENLSDSYFMLIIKLAELAAHSV